MIEVGEYTIEFVNGKTITHVWVDKIIYTPEAVPIILCTDLGKMYNWVTVISLYPTGTTPSGMPEGSFRKSANPYGR